MATSTCRLLAKSRLLERVLPAGSVSRCFTALSSGQQLCSGFQPCSETAINGIAPRVPSVCHQAITLPSNLLAVPRRHKGWYTDKRISQNLGAVGVPEVDEDFTVLTDQMEGQELAQMVNTNLEHGAGRLFAVVSIAGLQRKVTTEDLLVIEVDFPPTVGDRIRLEKVLMVGGQSFSLIGQPLLSRDQVRVEGTVVEKTLSHNRIWSTYKARKRFRKIKLFRTPQTMIVINSIELASVPQ